jgi:hypothetical protein
MEARIVTEKERKAWDDFVMDNPASIAWQSYGWSEVVRKHYGIAFYPLAVYDGARICGILPLYRVKKGIKGKDELLSVPYAVAGGVLSDEPAVQSILLDRAIQMSRQFGSCRITLKQYKTNIEADLLTDDNYYNRELSLSMNRDELWSRISENNREKVTDALKLGGVLEYPSSDIDAFYKLLLQHLHGSGIPCVGKQWIKDLLAFQMYSIALLKVGGRVVAGTMVKEFKNTISFPFTCLAEKDIPVALPAYALYWKLIEHFAARGKDIFHSGRIPLSDDTEPHRLGWGGTKYRYYYQYAPNSPTRTEYASKRGRKRDLFKQGWKRLPLGIAGYLGPYVVKQFP